MIKIAFDCVGTLVRDINGNETISDVLSMYRELHVQNKYEMIVWSSEFELARKVMSRYGLQATRLAKKNDLNVDVAFDDHPEGVVSAGIVIDVTQTGWQDKAHKAINEIVEQKRAI